MRMIPFGSWAKAHPDHEFIFGLWKSLFKLVSQQIKALTKTEILLKSTDVRANILSTESRQAPSKCAKGRSFPSCKRRMPLRHGLDDLLLHRTLESWQPRRANPSPYTLQGTSLAWLAMEHSAQLTQPTLQCQAKCQKDMQKDRKTERERERERDGSSQREWHWITMSESNNFFRLELPTLCRAVGCPKCLCMEQRNICWIIGPATCALHGRAEKWQVLVPLQSQMTATIPRNFWQWNGSWI